MENKKLNKVDVVTNATSVTKSQGRIVNTNNINLFTMALFQLCKLAKYPNLTRVLQKPAKNRR